MTVIRQPGLWTNKRIETLGVSAPGAYCEFKVDAEGVGVRLEIWGGGTYTGTVERSGDDGASWQPLTAAGVQLYDLTGSVSETIADETQRGARYRVNIASYSAGTVNVRISQ